MTKFIVILFAVLMPLALGCGNQNRKPRYDIGEPLEIQPFKRYGIYNNRDFIRTWKHEAFSPVTEPLRRRLSESQKDILERQGQPDYVRRSFKATTGETVDEWAWWDREVIGQFVQRELVFEGLLTDMDKTLIRYGYPRRSWRQAYEAGGVQRDIWDYQGFLIDTRGAIMTFSEGKLISKQDY